MSPSEGDPFLNVLCGVLEREASVIKTQKHRLKVILDSHWPGIDFQIPPIDNFSFDIESFQNDLAKRIETLGSLFRIYGQVKDALVRVVQVLLVFYLNSDKFQEEFPNSDKEQVKYLIAESLLGSLLPLIPLCLFTLDLDLLVFGSFGPLLRVAGLSSAEIADRLENYGISAEADAISLFLNSYLQQGNGFKLSKSIGEEGETVWKLEKQAPITQTSQEIFDSTLMPLINWAIGTWRSLYNIRELDTAIPAGYLQADGLRQVTSRAATQGYQAASEVIYNLQRYFEFLENAKSPKPA